MTSKKLFSACMLLLLSGVLQQASAAIQVNFHSKVIQGDCALDFSTIGDVMDLGKITENDVAKTPGYHSVPHLFHIGLRHCDPHNLLLSFGGISDPVDPRLLSINDGTVQSASGVGVAFYNRNEGENSSQIIPLNQPFPAPITLKGHNDIELNFAAQLVADGQPLRSGLSMPIVNVSAIYQ